MIEKYFRKEKKSGRYVWYHQMDNEIKVVNYKAWILKTNIDVMEIGDGSQTFYSSSSSCSCFRVGLYLRIVNLKSRRG